MTVWVWGQGPPPLWCGLMKKKKMVLCCNTSMNRRFKSNKVSLGFVWYDKPLLIYTTVPHMQLFGTGNYHRVIDTRQFLKSAKCSHPCSSFLYISVLLCWSSSQNKFGRATQSQTTQGATLNCIPHHKTVNRWLNQSRVVVEGCVLSVCSPRNIQSSLTRVSIHSLRSLDTFSHTNYVQW